MANDTTVLPVPGDESFSKSLGAIADAAFAETGGDVYSGGRTTTEDAKSEGAGESQAEGEKATVKADESSFLGNWKTKDEATKGLQELNNHTKNALQRADEEAQRRVESEQRLADVIKAISGKKEEAAVDPLDTLESLAAIPKEHFAKAVDTLIERKFEAIMKPANDRRAADVEMSKITPEWDEKVNDVVEFLKRHPDVKAEVDYAEAKGEYLLARKFAWKLYKVAGEVEKQIEVTAKKDTRIEKIKDALPDAGFTTDTRADGRLAAAASEEGGPDWPSAQRMKYLKTMMDNGHPDVMWRETIGKMLSKQGFDNL